MQSRVESIDTAALCLELLNKISSFAGDDALTHLLVVLDYLGCLSTQRVPLWHLQAEPISVYLSLASQ